MEYGRAVGVSLKSTYSASIAGRALQARPRHSFPRINQQTGLVANLKPPENRIRPKGRSGETPRGINDIRRSIGRRVRSLQTITALFSWFWF